MGSVHQDPQHGHDDAVHIHSRQAANGKIQHTEFQNFTYRVNVKPHFVQFHQHQERPSEQHDFNDSQQQILPTTDRRI